jgi:hypothetical protein
MNDIARQKLIRLMDAESESALDDTERFEALLRDYCGDCKQEISALMAALEEDVPRDLRRLQNEPFALLTARLAMKLHEERSIYIEAAQWAVETWAVALGIGPGARQMGGANAPVQYVAAPPNYSPVQQFSGQQFSAPQFSAPPISAPQFSTPQASQNVSPLISPAQPGAATVFCVSCGAPDNYGSIFCTACGAKLFYPDATPSAAT